MKYLLYIFLFICFNGYAQFGPQRIISTEADGSRIICAADVDGDNYIDILSANNFGNNLTWYKNLDGLGNFGSQNILASLDTIHVHASDLDGDGDMDVLAVSYFIDMVVWYENLDGLGNFSTQKVISNTADGAYRVIAADLDGDSDMDVISGSDNTGIAWYENIDGNGNFGLARVINAFAPNARSIATADIDGDGDMDVVASTSGTVTVSWYENLDGLGNFGPQKIITTNGLSVEPIFTIDIDGDGDIDVIAATGGADKVAWYENLDGLGNFGPENIIIDDLLNAHAIYSSDLDNDGDNDLLATGGGAFDGEVVWFENLDGQGSFGAKNIISTEVQFSRSVIAADIDNDGDMDVIASSQNDDKIAWYENYTILSVEENQINSLTVYPNPTKGLIYINPKTKTIISIGVFDILGKKVLQLEGNIQQVDISTLQSGMYFLRIATNAGSFVRKIIKE
ncbi:T9SS type A sorting domain-containing protein [Aequorivita nionensis]|uniref:T9SS type A sorting domain-containing protein n=1 Tax=Aequorivita nionensis TaxID=1287690 RepID=UPI003965CDA0